MEAELKFVQVPPELNSGRVIVAGIDASLKHTTVMLEAWYEHVDDDWLVITGYGDPKGRRARVVHTELEAQVLLREHHARAVKRARPVEPDAHLKVYGNR